jgi:hypothetical protein
MISRTSEARQSVESRPESVPQYIVSCERLYGSCLDAYGERLDPVLELVYLSKRRATLSVEIDLAVVGQNGTILRITLMQC